MATVPAISPVSSTNQASSTKTIARPRRDDTDYTPIIRVDDKWRVAPAYANLPDHKLQYAFEAFRQGIPESGKRMANCLLCGAVFARTKFNRKLALAHKFPCGEMCCFNCNRAEYRLRAWMRNRDPERIYNSCRQVGIELGIPSCPSYQGDRDHLHSLVRELEEWLGLEQSVILDQAPDAHTTVRMIGTSSGLSNCPEIRAKWREIAGPDATITFRHPEGVKGQAAKRLFLWGFEGMEKISTWPIPDQVAFRIATADLPMVRTRGTYYRRLTEPELAERKQREQEQLLDSMERKGWIMEYIPYHERIVQTLDDIEDGYERVEYHTEFSETFVYPHTHATAADRASP